MKKKYILKPGRHQFAPGSPAVHTNANLSDEDVEWYLTRYPHIAALIEKSEEELDQEPELEPVIEESVNKIKNQ
jgi:hypothetical protein